MGPVLVSKGQLAAALARWEMHRRYEAAGSLPHMLAPMGLVVSEGTDYVWSQLQTRGAERAPSRRTDNPQPRQLPLPLDNPNAGID